MRIKMTIIWLKPEYEYKNSDVVSGAEASRRVREGLVCVDGVHNQHHQRQDGCGKAYIIHIVDDVYVFLLLCLVC